MDVGFAAVDAASCVTSGPGLSAAQVNQPAAFTIVARDRFGNDVTTGTESFQWSMTAMDQSETLFGDAVLVSGAQYRVTFTVKRTAAYVLAASYKNMPLFTSKVLKPAVGPASAASSFMVGSGLSGGSAGASNTFIIYSRDSNGNPRRSNNDAYTITISDSVSFSLSVAVPSSASSAANPAVTTDAANNKLQVEYLSNGRYLVTYLLRGSASYNISVDVGGAPISNSLVTVFIRPAAFDASQCAVTAGLSGSQLVSTAGVQSLFTMVSKGSQGNVRSQFRDVFSVQVVGPSSVAVTVNDKNNGYYDAVYTSYVAGTYTTLISVLGGALPQSPIVTLVEPAAIHVPSTVVTGPGLVSVVAGVQTSITVTLRDQFLNVRNPSVYSTVSNEVGSIGLAFTYAGAASVASSVSNNDGSYTFSYTADAAASILYNISVGGQQIPGVYATTVVPGVTVAATTLVTASSLQAGSKFPDTVAGVENSFTVQARDAQGNDVTENRAADVFAVSISLASLSDAANSVNAQVGEAVPAALRSVDYVGFGQYLVSYTPLKTGTYQVTVTLNGAPISNSGASVLAKDAPTRAAGCIVQGLALTNATAGQAATFSVTARDAFNNVVDNADSFRWALTAAGAQFSGSAVRVSYGVYSVTYSTTLSGYYSLNLDLGSRGAVFLGGNPQIVDVAPAAASGLHSVARGAGLVSAVAGVQASFRVEVRDRFNNRIRDTVPVVAAVFTKPAAVASAVANPVLVPEVAGLYSATYTLTVASVGVSQGAVYGSYGLTISVDGVAIPVNFNVTVNAAPAHSASCQVVAASLSGSSLLNVYAGAARVFTINCGTLSATWSPATATASA